MDARLALVGPQPLTSAFSAYLDNYYPGLTADAVAALGCVSAPPPGFPSFAGLVTVLADEAALEAYVLATDYGISVDKPPIYAAVVFQSAPASAPGGTPGSGWAYKLRLNLTDAPPTWGTTQPLQRAVTSRYQTQYLYAQRGADGSYGGSALHSPGFMPLQLAVDRFILNATAPAGYGSGSGTAPSLSGRRLHSNLNTGEHSWMPSNPNPLMPGNTTDAANGATAFLSTWGCTDPSVLPPAAVAPLNAFLSSHGLAPQHVQTGIFPQIGFTNTNFYTILSSNLPLVLVLSLFPASFGLIRGIVTEKEARLREGMLIMSGSPTALVASWYVTGMAIFGTIALGATLVTRAALFARSDGSLIFALFFCFGLASVAACVAVSAVFSKAKLASIVGSVIIVALVFPYFTVNDSTKPAILRRAGSLAAPTAFGLALDIICAFEAAGTGLHWSDLSVDVGTGWTIGQSLVFLLGDALLYGLLAAYLDAVVPQEFGLSRPFYFFVTPTFWMDVMKSFCSCVRGGVKRQAEAGEHSNLLLGGGDEGIVNGVPTAPATSDVTEPLSSFMADRVTSGHALSLRGLVKIFPTPDGPKTAVARVSLDCVEGQITVLLGHNGAGKTTTMNLLTGMTPPTAGDACAYGISISNDMEAFRRQLGVCPQHDVLWPTLTVTEHLTFFAGLKGVPPADVRAAVDDVIRRVGLTEKTNSPSATLSGGQKRKLCLGIALIGT